MHGCRFLLCVMSVLDDSNAARAGNEGSCVGSESARLVESCSRLSQGWDRSRSCWDMKSFAVPDWIQE